MELFPTMRWGWLNGWLVLSGVFVVFGLLLLGFSRDIGVYPGFPTLKL